MAKSKLKDLSPLKHSLEVALNKCKIAKNHLLWPLDDDSSWDFSTEAAKFNPKYITPIAAWRYLNYAINSVTGAPENSNPMSLKEFLGEKKFNSLHNEIVKHMKSVPFTYEVFLPIKGKFERIVEKQNEIKLSPKISIFSPDESNSYLKFGLDRYNSLSSFTTLSELANLSSALVKNKVYLKVITSGFIFDSIYDIGFDSVLQSSKATVMASQTLKIFKKTTPSNTPVKATIFQYGKRVSKTPSETFHVEIPINISHILSSFEYIPSTIPSKGKTLLSSTFSNIEFRFTPLKNLFNYKYRKDTKSIITALIWAFDSLANEKENETISFVLLSIALEAIFGSRDDRTNTTNLLSNRVAFFVGGPPSKRATMIKSFKEFYKIRSQIVHGREASLKSNERSNLHWARNLLYFCIKREIDQLHHLK